MKPTLPSTYHAALALERALGDPMQPENPLSYRQAMQHDEREAFPEAAIGELHRLGLHRAFVPKALGGDFDSSESFIALGRVLARRDMNVAVSYCTMLWSVLAWIGGSAAQKKQVAHWVAQAGYFPCLAYSEQAHGADLLANELTAVRGPDGRYRVSGEKWPINRATRSQFVVLLARTHEAAHMRNHSLFIVDKSQLDARQVSNLPRVPTHGLRGCDISGIRFDDCLLPDDALVGEPGHGLEWALKGFQVTRTFCNALSLGVADSALRIVTGFATQRRLYGQTVMDLPHARDVLANAYASQLMAECCAITASRGLHLFTEQFSSWSSIAKVQVTHLCDHTVAQLAQLLGARYFMREGLAEGMFQKFMRDGGIVSVFDGSSTVCLDALATFLPDMSRYANTALPADAVAGLYDLHQSLPRFDGSRLTLLGRGRDAVMQSLPTLLSLLQSLGESDGACIPEIQREAQRLAQAWQVWQQAVVRDRAERGQRNSARAFGLAEQLCAMHCAVSCLGLWLHNRTHLGDFFAEGVWLIAALQRGGDPHFKTGQLHPQLAQILCDQLCAQHDDQHMFSILPWPLAGAATSPKFVPSTSQESANDECLAH